VRQEKQVVAVRTECGEFGRSATPQVG